MTAVILNETDKAWMAGFVDGEGCLTISRQDRPGRPSPAFRVVVSVSNTNRAVLEPFVAAYGGCLYLVRENRTGARREKWADALNWHCPGLSVPRLLADLSPYFRLKAPHAAILSEFIRTSKGFGRGPRLPGKRGGSSPLTAAEVEHRDALRTRIQLLNAKGPRREAV